MVQFRDINHRTATAGILAISIRNLGLVQLSLPPRLVSVVQNRGNIGSVKISVGLLLEMDPCIDLVGEDPIAEPYAALAVF